MDAHNLRVMLTTKGRDDVWRMDGPTPISLNSYNMSGSYPNFKLAYYASLDEYPMGGRKEVNPSHLPHIDNHPVVPIASPLVPSTSQTPFMGWDKLLKNEKRIPKPEGAMFIKNKKTKPCYTPSPDQKEPDGICYNHDPF